MLVWNLEEPVAWLHITSPSDWSVAPASAFLLIGAGVVMRHTAEPISLMRHALTTSASALSFQDLVQCARFDNDVDIPEWGDESERAVHYHW